MADDLRHLAVQTITTVQLPASTPSQRLFLRQLQAALAPNGTLSALTPGPSPGVYLIPHDAEQCARAARGVGTDKQWEQLLKQWGALSVSVLALDAYIALETRGASVHQGALISPPKVSAPHPAPQQKAVGAAFVPAAFAGPYDWHIDRRGVGASDAWRMFAATPAFAAQLPWADIRVAHIDTGYTEHAALGWHNGNSAFVKTADGKDFWNGDHDQDGPRDPFLPGFPGHGTRIAAAIAGFYPNAPGGPFYGVAPGVQIVPYRVTDSVMVDHVQHHIRDAIHAAIRSNCHVINISLGAVRASKSLAAALDDAYDAGLIVVCAAGQVWGEVIYPGRFNRCVTMGGVGPGRVPWRSAAKGIHVDLCAPADEIRRVHAQDLPPGQTATKMAPKTGDGTSYATAACAGAAALWLAWHGLSQLKAAYGPGGLWQIPKAFKYLAMTTAAAGTWPTTEADQHGRGVLDIPALLAAPLPAAGTLRKENPAYGLFDDSSR